MDGTSSTRVLVATEPRAYREVMTGALQELRPGAEILLVEPDDLHAALTRLRPHLVVSSRSVETLPDCPVAWVLLYPAGATTVVICVDGRRTTLDDLPFERLLSLVDEVCSPPPVS
ncbi:MAG: hypothetical protein M3R02_29100 [Chloroflexota bacterium]|nr:hypothetical protein [Chloroflexota bacterium]